MIDIKRQYDYFWYFRLRNQPISAIISQNIDFQALFPMFTIQEYPTWSYFETFQNPKLGATITSQLVKFAHFWKNADIPECVLNCAFRKIILK